MKKAKTKNIENVMLNEWANLPISVSGGAINSFKVKSIKEKNGYIILSDNKGGILKRKIGSKVSII